MSHEVLGRYRLGARIGGGGMAEVFAGTLVGAEGFHRSVAIKRVRPHFSADPEFAKMFVNEARVASMMDHDNVVRVHDFDRDSSGVLYLVMEYVRGGDLAALLAGGPLPPLLASAVCADVLSALAYAHALMDGERPLGLVHRDVSPHNILLSWRGCVKLSDFGIARAETVSGATSPGALKGKFGYMSPEQIRGRALDGRSDLFALGAVLYEMVVGARPFARGTEAEVLARTLYQPVVPPRERGDVPAWLSDFAMRLLSREPDARPAGAAQALAEWVAADKGARDADRRESLGRLMRRRLAGGEDAGVAEEEISATAPTQSPAALDAGREKGATHAFAPPGRFRSRAAQLAVAVSLVGLGGWAVRDVTSGVTSDEPPAPALVVEMPAPAALAELAPYGPELPPESLTLPSGVPPDRQEIGGPRPKRPARSPATRAPSVEVPLGRASPDEVPVSR